MYIFLYHCIPRHFLLKRKRSSWVPHGSPHLSLTYLPLPYLPIPTNGCYIIRFTFFILNFKKLCVRQKKCATFSFLVWYSNRLIRGMVQGLCGIPPNLHPIPILRQNLYCTKKLNVANFHNLKRTFLLAFAHNNVPILLPIIFSLFLFNYFLVIFDKRSTSIL